MKLTTLKTLRLYFLGALFLHSACFAMTTELGFGGGDIVSVGEPWRFLPGTEAPSVPENAWTELDFNDAGWALGPSGFGYGDNDDATILNTMRNNYVAVYLRKAFSASALPPDATVELVIPPTHHASGTLAGDVTWSGAMLLDHTVTVPADHVLTIEAGTVILMKANVGITVHGQLMANGTDSQPIHFTHYGDGTTWERMMFVDAEDSRLSHCTITMATMMMSTCMEKACPRR